MIVTCDDELISTYDEQNRKRRRRFHPLENWEVTTLSEMRHRRPRLNHRVIDQMDACVVEASRDNIVRKLRPIKRVRSVSSLPRFGGKVVMWKGKIGENETHMQT